MPTLGTYNTRMQLCRLQRMYRFQHVKVIDARAVEVRVQFM